jgi:hypothetical protein
MCRRSNPRAGTLGGRRTFRWCHHRAGCTSDSGAHSCDHGGQRDRHDHRTGHRRWCSGDPAGAGGHRGDGQTGAPGRCLLPSPRRDTPACAQSARGGHADGGYSSPWSRHASTVSDVNARRSRRSQCPAHAAHVDPRRIGGRATPTCTVDRIRLADQPVTTPCAASSHARPHRREHRGKRYARFPGRRPAGGAHPSRLGATDALRHRRGGPLQTPPATSPRSPVLPTWLSTSVVFCGVLATTNQQKNVKTNREGDLSNE